MSWPEAFTDAVKYLCMTAMLIALWHYTRE